MIEIQERTQGKLNSYIKKTEQMSKEFQGFDRELREENCQLKVEKARIEDELQKIKECV